MTSHASEAAALPWVSWTFVFAGALTGAAIVRVGIHTFFGWGEKAISDRAAELGELPETRASDQTISWFLFLPAAICIAGSAALTLVPGLQWHVMAAAQRLCSQSGYISTVYGQPITFPQAVVPHIATREVLLHCLVAGLLALVLVTTSILRGRLTRYLRWGAFLEGPLVRMRDLQSGHPGDYVMWLTVGVAAVGWTFALLLR